MGVKKSEEIPFNIVKVFSNGGLGTLLIVRPCGQRDRTLLFGNLIGLQGKVLREKGRKMARITGKKLGCKEGCTKCLATI